MLCLIRGQTPTDSPVEHRVFGVYVQVRCCSCAVTVTDPHDDAHRPLQPTSGTWA